MVLVQAISIFSLIHHAFHFSAPLLLLLSRFSRVRLCATPQMAAYQAPLSLGFSGQEYWSGLPLPSPNPCYNPPIISIAKDFSPKARQVLENLSQLRG